MGASPVSDAGHLPETTATLYARWIRSVDLLWRETVHRKLLAGGERRRAERRARSLRKIVRRALSEYHRVASQRER